MLTCETCGVSFEPKKGLEEVTSLRVLCPSCAAARAAAKLKARGGARETRPVRSAGGDARPPRQEQAVKAPAPVAAPRPQAAARVRAHTSEPAAAKAAPARPPTKPAPDSEALRAEAEEVSRQLKKKGSRELRLSFAIAFIVTAVAGVVLWMVLGKKRQEAAIAQAQRERIEDFKTTFMAFDIQEEGSAKRLIEHADEHKLLWAELEFAPEVISRVAKAKNFLEGQQQRRDLEQRLNDIEQALARAAELAPSELAEQRRRLEELSARAGIAGTEFLARVARDREQAEEVYLDRLVAAAEAAGSADPLDRAALATIQQSEDETLKIFEASYKAWQKNPQDAALIAKKDAHQEKYQGLIRLADEAVQRFFTPEVVETTPWRDLLSVDQASQWKSPVARGYSRNVENGVLRLIGPDPSEKSEIIMSIGDKEVWRDFEIDTEFTIEKGQFTLYFRLPLVWQENVFNFDLKTDEGYLLPGQPYSYTFRIFGSTFTEEQHSEDSLGPTVDNVSWTRPRKGAFGIAVSKETEVKFTRLRARVLR